MIRLQPLPPERKRLVDAALGRCPFDLIVRNIQLVNVFTGEIYPAEIGIIDGFIAYTGYGEDLGTNAGTVVDGKGRYAVPGFIDSHVHIESSMLTPDHFADLVIPRGTTTVVTDPHEIANVLGLVGVKYMLEAARGLPMYQFALAPSCVPAVPGKESSGAEFGRDEIAELLDLPGVLGVAEVMDYEGVLEHSERMEGILDLATERDAFIQGHFFGQDTHRMAAYICGGPISNHEFMSGAEALNALRFGMAVDARDSSFCRNIHSIVSGVKGTYSPANLTLCTDDRHPEEVMNSGHIDDCLRSAVDAGLNPIDAVRAATINIARIYRLDRRLGAIAPGYRANLNLVEDLKSFRVTDVFFEGKHVSSDGSMKVGISPEKSSLAEEIENKNTVILPQVIDEKLLSIKVPHKGDKAEVVVIAHNDPDSALTHPSIETVDVKDGIVNIDSRPDLNYVAILNRHGYPERVSLGLISQFHLKSGAVAGTVCHDSHNLAVVYTNARDAIQAIEEIKRIGGGIAYAQKGSLESLPLPVGGLMSQLPAEELIPSVQRMNTVLAQAGLSCENPVMRIATIALPVVPSIKITDMGLVNTDTQKFIDFFVRNE